MQQTVEDLFSMCLNETDYCLMAASHPVPMSIFAFHHQMPAPPQENFKFMLRGFADGVRGRLGRFDG